MPPFARRFSIGVSVVMVTVLLAVGGCDQPAPTRQQAAPIDPVDVPSARLVDSMTVVLDRFRATSAPTATDSATLRRWIEAVPAAADSLAPPQAQQAFRTALQAARALGDSARMAQSLGGLGQAHEQQSQYSKARARYEDALRISRALGLREQMAARLHDIGDVHRAQGRYAEAEAPYAEAISIRRALGDRAGLARTLNNAGLAYEYQGHYDEARRRYEESLAIKRKLGDREGVANTLNNLGIMQTIRGNYRQALTRWEDALAIRRKLGDREGVARTLNNIGNLHKRQGQFGEALSRYREALEILRAMGDREASADVLNNIGIIYRRRGQYEKARARYEASLAIKREVGDQPGVARTLNNLGRVHQRQGRYEKARARYEESLAIKREIGDRRGIANSLSNIGEIEEAQGRPDAALRRYRRTLRIDRAIGRRDEVAFNLGHIGDVYLEQGRLQRATDTLGRAVQLAENLRRRATAPEARRSLLSTQISVYRALTTAHVRSGRPDSALRAVEQARARLLAGRLAGAARTDTVFSVPPPDELRRTLGAEEAALLYANAGPERPLTALVVTADTTYAQEVPETQVRADIESEFAAALRRVRQEKGPLTAALADTRPATDGEAPGLAEVIRLYRSHLTRKTTGDSTRRALARQLHDLLIAPVEPHLRDENTITVVPTGALGYLPFEALRDANGRYLVQQKQVRYAQSLTVLHQLQGRTYPSDRRPLLAVGGAVYGGPAPSGDGPLLAEARRSTGTTRSDSETARLHRTAERWLEQGQSPRSIYAKLGHGQWPALYGTQLEVQKLRRALGPETTLLTGTDASEERIRRMSISGELAEYRQVHFATHGMAVPEAPSLSALVLSQEEVSDSLASNDGYLTMGEIADLEMQADVAVLSACRTGLGRIIAGEGVVSLSHAFLRAGANATLVSQWRVLDWSTQQFMTRVYREARSEETTFAEAVTEVKRSFIAGDFGPRNADPLRWAPFVYYGRE